MEEAMEKGAQSYLGQVFAAEGTQVATGGMQATAGRTQVATGGMRAGP